MTAAEKLVDETRYTRTIRCEIIKPVGSTWDELGPKLRRTRSVMHRLLNAAVLACIDAHRGIISKHPQTAAYAAVAAELESFRAWAASHKDPQVRGLAAVDVCGGVRSAITNAATAAFMKWKKERGNVGVPSFKKGQPIPLRAEECEIVKSERGADFRFKLASGSGDWERVALAHSSGKHAQVIRKLVSATDGYKALAAKVDYCDRSKKWFVLLSYSAPVQAVEVDPERLLVVHRGARSFAACLSSSGQFAKISGNKVMAQKRRLKARRQDARKTTAAELGDGAKGHGTARRYATTESLLEKERRVVDTFCKQSAARIRELALQWGCGTVVIGDYGGVTVDEDRAIRRFVITPPLYKLKQSIVDALQPFGLSVREVSESYVSQDCPACGYRDARSANHHRGMFHCIACGFDRELDYVSSVHMLRRANPIKNVVDARLSEQKELGSRMRLRDSKSDSDREESGDSTPQARGKSPLVNRSNPDLSGESRETPCPPGQNRASAREDRERVPHRDGGGKVKEAGARKARRKVSNR